ncbi:UDP-N-acetylmuramate dehydrogenase [Thalassotalea euphylliae]|uniref:UDP-N-acetylenolpyruvoylglucosamine reductase n=1 Tax=Thalassotalea euphylliae TaxID=1655234 RepID=A0A3E0UAS8_9GAMM|nr:UDP-N-acetylmuramate dehydrogenase [Thalassotalea euphylliae]REL34098.1 UDP-N-acetylmuramate dehydrogenase [Thalassotalea euphylliae]
MQNLLAGSVRHLNSMAIDSHCSKLIEISTLAELAELTIPDEPFYILGEGSNTLFVESNTPTLLKPKLKGIEVTEQQDKFVLNIGAGENWHELVEYTVTQGMPGLENLALIPGSVGAAPVQNIGAYGVELADFCHSVTWFDFATKQLQTLSAAECLFGYRESVFKHALKGKGIIASVTLALPKNWQPVLSYAGLNTLPENVDAKTIMAKVIDIRNSKLPNPIELPNNGSFFKNPIVDTKHFEQLQQDYPDMPFYTQTNNQVKLAAGWLIEKVGLKGYRAGDAGVHEKQALVLVNFGQASGEDIVQLAQLVIAKVFAKFAVQLEPEVRLIGKGGECSLTDSVS